MAESDYSPRTSFTDRLPFETKIVHSLDEAVIIYRATIKTPDDAENWLKAYSTATTTHWVVSRTYRTLQKLVFRKDYVCHRSSLRRACPDINKRTGERKNERGLSKNCGCPVAVIVKIYMDKSRERYAKQGFQGFIKVSGTHNHSNSNMEALSLLPSSQGLRNIFEEYFSSGMGITEAISYHRNKLEMADDYTESVLADATRNPKYRTVVYWHTTWLQFTTADSGPLTGSSVTTLLREKMPTYEDFGCRILIGEDPFSIVILTPIMSRAHCLSESAQVCFVDCHTSCGAQSLTVSYFLLPCAAGVIPLAVVVTKLHSELDYICGFRRLRQSNCELFGRRGYPIVFVTGDDDAEKSALRSVWPESKQTTCPFQVMLANWRWLWSTENHIPLYDRPILISEFRGLILSPLALIEANYMATISSTTALKYPQWCSRIQSYWERKECWCVAWWPHDLEISKFTETAVRLFRDNLVSRVKAYNVIALVDYICTTMEQYCSNRLMDFAISHLTMPVTWIGRLLEKAKRVCSDAVLPVSESVFGVTSQTDPTMTYWVDVSERLCSCSDGRCGVYCEHLTVVTHLKTDSAFPDTTPVLPESCHAMAVLAVGGKADEPSFYSQRTAETNKLWDAFISLLGRRHRSFGNTATGLQTMMRRLERISSSGQWETFFHG